MKEELLKYFPQHIQEILIKENLNSIEEIRVRNNLPLILRFGQAQKILNYIINTEDINYIFQKICENFPDSDSQSKTLRWEYPPPRVSSIRTVLIKKTIHFQKQIERPLLLPLYLQEKKMQ